MAENGNAGKIGVGGDFDGNLIQGNNNAIVNNKIDSEELGQSIGETLAESAQAGRWQELHYESERENSRQVMETIFVSLVSGLAIGACWELASPWNVETVPFFVIGSVVLFNILNLTHFGVRRSMSTVVSLSVLHMLLLNFTTAIQIWMNVNQFVGTVVLGSLGAIFGLVAGVVLLFWHPLED